MKTRTVRNAIALTLIHAKRADIMAMLDAQDEISMANMHYGNSAIAQANTKFQTAVDTALRNIPDYYKSEFEKRLNNTDES